MIRNLVSSKKQEALMHEKLVTDYERLKEHSVESTLAYALGAAVAIWVLVILALGF